MSPRWRRRLHRAWHAAPLAARLFCGTGVVVALWFAVNGAYQVARKPC